MRYDPEDTRPEPTVEIIGIDDAGKEHHQGTYTPGEAIIHRDAIDALYPTVIVRTAKT